MFTYIGDGVPLFLIVAIIDVLSVGVNPKSDEDKVAVAITAAELSVKVLVPVIIFLALIVPLTVRFPVTVPPLSGK